MIGKVAIAAALRGLNDRTFGDPYIFFQKQITFTVIYTLSRNKQKNEREKFKKNLSMGHRVLPLCDCKSRETPMVAKFELVLYGTSPVDKILLMDPLKQ